MHCLVLTDTELYSLTKRKSYLAKQKWRRSTCLRDQCYDVGCHPCYDRLAKIYTNCTGHMTKMATMPIYGKIPLNIFFSGTKRPWDLVCSIAGVCPIQFAQMMNLG